MIQPNGNDIARTQQAVEFSNGAFPKRSVGFDNATTASRCASHRTGLGDPE